ncbi:MULTISPECIES: sporulation delaying protein family toxin [Bacillales]|uniref:sporulation delaying protein family toxin n=1 Tax=Bacillales TaxID=1385 RepID=UPI00069783D5|nr:MULTISPECIES: sporulation delaying protein family toxin [Bacillaceae]
MKKKNILSILLAFTLLIGSFPFNTNAALNKKMDKTYSGEEIFRGVLLGQGPVAEMFKEMWPDEIRKQANNEANIKFTNDIIKQMKKEDPTYFNSLKKAIYSKDYLKTQNLFHQGAKKFIQIAEEKNKVEIARNGDLGDAHAQGLTAVLVAGITMVAIYSHAALLTFYLWAAAAGPGLSSATNKLENEKMVHDVITTLAH